MMKTQWLIRRAVTEDSTDLQRCMQSAYASYQDRMEGKRLPPMELDYATEIRDFPTWVAELDGKIAGGLTMMFARDHASIANIAVHPAMQGQGLGSTLMHLAEDIARQQGYLELQLATHVLLTENISLYRHLGWIETDRDDVRVYMKKTL